jgi:fatty acid desaturase
MTKARDLLSAEEIRALTRASDWRGALSCAWSFGLAAAALAAAAIWPQPLVILGALVVLGGQQLGMAVLLHECAHSSLFATRGLHRWAGGLCGAAIWNDVARYREHHIRHHTRTNREDDPDLGLVAPFPTSRAGVARKLARDLTGIAGLRRFAGLLLIDLGFFSYTASTGARRLRPSAAEVARSGARNLWRPLLFHGGLLAVVWALGVPWLFALWWGAWLTTFGAFLRIRSWAEHAVTERSGDPLRNVRTTLAGPIARLTVAPHQVNYHLEHHLLLNVPHYRLPAMHALLRERGVFNERNLAGGYLEVIRLVGSRS